MEDLVSFLAKHRPFSFWLEEVLGFLKVLESLGTSPCHLFVAKLKGHGYHCIAIAINHGAFIRNTRNRVFVVGVHEDAGGRAAALEIQGLHG